MTEQIQSLARIPMNRVAVLIGAKGETRKELEKISGAKIIIDSLTGEVTAVWSTKNIDPILMMKMPDAIKAIGRGIPPKKAILMLKNEDLSIQIIDLKKWTGKRGTQISRLRSRLIGRNGRIRSLIEEYTKTDISIHGHTVTVIGHFEGLSDARQTIEIILNGAEHSTAIRALERKRKSRKEQRRMIDYIELKENNQDIDAIEKLVPGLTNARQRRRKSKQNDLDINDRITLQEIIQLKPDESISWSEE